MNALKKLGKSLNDIVQREGQETVETLAGYVVGELLGDYEGVYEALRDRNPDVARIADLAGDLEWSNGSPAELEAMWQELKSLVKKLDTVSQE